MTRGSGLVYAFLVCFIAANALALVHIIALVIAVKDDQFAVYNYWVGYFFTVICIFLLISNVMAEKYKYISSVLLYFGTIVSNLSNESYFMVYQEISDGAISITSFLVVIAGFILPLFGIIVGALSLKQLGGK